MKQKYLLLNLLVFSYANFAIAVDNSDLIYDKIDRRTPININDDHITVRKIKESEIENVAVSGGNIYFDLNKAEINNTEQIKVEEIAKAIIPLIPRIEKIVIEGFASKDGDPLRNFDLGIERALVVKKALIELGVKDDLFETYSYGDESMYKFQNVKKNRRTQIKIHLKLPH